MKKSSLVLAGVAGLVLSGATLAAPSTYVEGALVDGGENARNGSSDQSGLEVFGSYALNDMWYVGGGIGRFTTDQDTGGDIDNDYININGGRTYSVTPKTDVIAEIGLWFGSQDNPSPQSDNDPMALELKTGFNHALTERLGVSGTLSWVNADLDTNNNDDLRNYIWSIGGSYTFNPNFSLNLKMINGMNGVNGQDEVLRFGARWTF